MYLWEKKTFCCYSQLQMGTQKRDEEAACAFLKNSLGYTLPGNRLECRAGWADYAWTPQFTLSM